jgi:hypothetical protein
MLFIGHNLYPPPFCPCFRQGEVFTPFVTVPETAVDKNHGAVFRKDNVWLAGQVLGMQPESETLRKQEPPHLYFRFGILAADLAHVVTAGLFVVNVAHATKIIEALLDSILFTAEILCLCFSLPEKCAHYAGLPVGCLPILPLNDANPKS